MTFQISGTSVGSVGALHSLAFSRAIVAIALAFIATGVPILAHLSGQPIGMAICVVLGLLIAGFAAPTLPVVLVFSYLFQNLFVSLVSPEIVDLSEFKAIRGYNFLLTATAWLVVVLRYWI